MTKAICVEPIGIAGGETYNAGEKYEVSAAILKEYAYAFKVTEKATTKKDASVSKENK
tara:strand:- start:912 stop:1085 length:174 start_codon:yes stop_codon:yes gene_type:complete